MGAEDEAHRQSRRVLRRLAVAWIEAEDREVRRWSAESRPLRHLLDTNVVSEWVKPRPDPGVVTWLADADEDRVVTLAELRHGIERMNDGSRRKRLDEWLRHELPLRFENRVLSIDAAVADAWGEMMARRGAVGSPIGPMEAFIAATAQVNEMTLVTRIVSDFQLSVSSIANPWSRA